MLCVHISEGLDFMRKRRLARQFLSNLEGFQYLLVIFDTQILKEIINNMVSSINSHVYSDLRIEKAISKVA